MSLVVWNMEVSVYVLAPMLEKVSWCCSYNGGYVAFGLWRLEQLRLQTAERQGQLPSLQIHGCTVRRPLLLNLPQATTKLNFVNDIYPAEIVFPAFLYFTR